MHGKPAQPESAARAPFRRWGEPSIARTGASSASVSSMDRSSPSRGPMLRLDANGVGLDVLNSGGGTVSVIEAERLILERLLGASDQRATT